MNKNKQEKPSPILMLAPIALVLLGYHYLFHASLNSELSEKRDKEVQLHEETHEIEQKKWKAEGQLQTVGKQLVEIKKETKIAQSELTLIQEQKSKIRSFVLGITETLTVGASQNFQDASTHSSNKKPGLKHLTTLQVSNQTTDPIRKPAPDENEIGLSTRMNLLCTILSNNNMQRLQTSESTSSPKDGLVETERQALSKLLDSPIPSVSRYKLKLMGNFSNLIAALTEVATRLPSVSVISISLDPVDLKVRRYVWNLEVGIRG
ncbi:MAG: hypothetical protein AAF623_07480 [Planctomycetota bacterium]